MAAINDIYQIKMKSLHPVGEECLNVFYYRVNTQTGTITAQVVADDFISDPLVEFRKIMSDLTLINEVSVINGMDNQDTNETNPSVFGTYGQDNTLPSALALAIRSRRNGAGTRRSYKRFTGIPSAVMTTSDGAIQETFQEIVEDVLTAAAASLVTGEGNLSPCQISGGFVLGTDPSFAFALTSPWEFNVYPTTQTTRQEYLWKAAD